MRLIVQMQSTPKMKLSYYEKSDQVWLMKKTKLDNDVTDCINMFYFETKIKLSGFIRPSAIYDEN